MSETASPWTIAGVVITMATALSLAFRWLFSRQSEDSAKRMHAENLQQFTMMGERLAKIEAPLARIDERLERAEMDVLELRRWKHERADPYIGAVEVLKSRIDTLEIRSRFKPGEDR